MIVKTLLTLACICCVSTFCFAGVTEKDSNIVINSCSDVYEFVFDKASNSVQVKQSLTVNYLCNNYRSVVPVFEFYNDRMVIDDVDFAIDGKKPKDIKPAFSYYQVDDYFYSDAHICYFALPLEKKGSSGKVVFHKTIKDPRYLTNVFFSDNFLVLNKQVVFKVPKWMNVELSDRNFTGNNIKRTVDYDAKIDADVYTYTATNVDARVKERLCPGPTYIYPHVLVMSKDAHPAGATFTYFKTVADQYAWYKNILSGLSCNEADIKAKAGEITAGKTDDLDKIKSIFYWVQNNIRYIAFEDGIAGFLPDKADEVLRKKYGDCKGMANLTKELLKSQGFDARLCWLGTNHIAYDYSTPSLAVDNHMICALMYKGKTYFLDATENYLSFNDYAERIQNRQVLIEDKDKYILTHVPQTTYAQNLDAEKRTLTIDGNNLTGTGKQEWKGEEKENILYQLNNMRKDKLKDAFSNYLSDNNTDYKISALSTSNLESIDGDLIANYTIQYNNAVTAFGKDYYIDLDFKKELNGSNFDVATRQHDFVFPYKSHVERVTELSIPTGYKVSSVPGNLSVNNNNYDFVINYEQKPGKIIYSKTIILKNTLVTKSAFKQWNDDINKLTEAYNQQIVLTAE